MRYNYVYQRSGGPLLSWKNGPPHQTRAADAVSLGSLSDPTLVLPKAGAPEPINDAYVSIKPMGDCQCHKKQAVGGISDTISGLSMPVKIAGVVGLYFLYKKLKKK